MVEITFFQIFLVTYGVILFGLAGLMLTIYLVEKLRGKSSMRVNDSEVIVDLLDGVEVVADIVEITTRDINNIPNLIRAMTDNRYVTFEYKNLHICYDTNKGLNFRVHNNTVTFRLQ